MPNSSGKSITQAFEQTCYNTLNGLALYACNLWLYHDIISNTIFIVMHIQISLKFVLHITFLNMLCDIDIQILNSTCKWLGWLR